MSIWLSELEVLKSIALHFKVLKHNSRTNHSLEFVSLPCWNTITSTKLAYLLCSGCGRVCIARNDKTATYAPRSIGGFDRTRSNGTQAMPSISQGNRDLCRYDPVIIWYGAHDRKMWARRDSSR